MEVTNRHQVANRHRRRPTTHRIVKIARRIVVHRVTARIRGRVVVRFQRRHRVAIHHQGVARRHQVAHHRVTRRHLRQSRRLQRYVLRMSGRVVGVRPHMGRRVVRVICITRATLRRSLGTRRIGRVHGRVVMRRIRIVREGVIRSTV